MSSEYQLTDFLPLIELDEYIAVDLETTGLDPKEDRITEISACRFINGEFTDEFTSLINPGILIPNNIVEITGITDEMVADAPHISEVLPGLIDFLDQSPMVGQNVNFDYSFIENHCIEYNLDIPVVPIYDTLALARSLIYFHNSFSLTSLCEYYNLSIENAHRASADAQATGYLFKYLIEEALSKPLTLIKRIEMLAKHAAINNRRLFSNILKTAIRMNIVDGLIESPSGYISPKNIFGEEQVTRISQLPDSSAEWFAEDGLICRNWKGYEKRFSQIEMIQDTYHAFSNNTILVAEAGTGLGKSLAYLSSGYIAAMKKKIHLVISTYTKNLQSQLFEEDIPRLSQAIDENIKAVIYKGRLNYICKTRLEHLISYHAQILKADEYEALLTLLVWEWETQTGDIYECNGFMLNKFKRLWALVRSERGYCSANQCRKYEGCYLGNLRNKVKDADIIIVNHALFANELQQDNTWFPEDFIYVIDEAHHFANVIRSQLVKEFSVYTLKDVFMYFNHDKKNWKIPIFKKHPQLYEIYDQLTCDCNIINQQLTDFFDSYYDSRSTDEGKKEYYMVKHLYRNSQEEFIEIYPNPWDILILLQTLEINVNKFSGLIMEYKEELPKSIIIEFDMVESCLQEGIHNFRVVLDTESDNVQWSSFIQREYQPKTILNSVPLKVNHFIHDHLLDHYSSGLFCSATLTVNEEFTYFSEKIGLGMASISHHVEEKIYPSPFHYSDQVKLFVYNHSMDVKDVAYMDEIASQIDKISSELQRRMLVLCTSYKQTVRLRQYLEPIINRDARKLIVQRPGISRNILVRYYLDHPHSILIGTSSFWEGVDFPGDKVEILCIIKTPFDNPFDPLVQSQIEDYTQQGENAFLQFQVPEAAMKLRQGFGRLIRNMSDTGICILMDTRLCRRQYGKTILDSLPVEAIPYQHVSKLISDSQKFF